MTGVRNSMVLLLLSAVWATAADVPSMVKDVTEANRRRYEGDADVLVLPGLVANRRERRVRVQAQATTIGLRDPVEFFLVAADSGHDYEALAISFAQPVDIHRALEFIGMAPGHPVDTSKLRFWPKGERVLMTFLYGDPLTGPGPVRAEALLLDQRTQAPLAALGMVFAGSSWLAHPDRPGEKLYAADRLEPHAIASSYNERTTVLDVPRQEGQGEVYGRLTANPERRLPAGDMVEVIMEPERRDGTMRVRELLLEVNVKDGSRGEGMADLELRLLPEGGKPLNRETGLNGALGTLTSLAEGDHDVFLSIHVAAEVTLAAVRGLFTILSSIEGERGIRVEPPLPGHLYYKAFLPDEKHRDRANRISQPWELRLRPGPGAVTGTLTRIEQTWRDDTLHPDLKATDWAVDSSEALRRELDARGPGMAVVLVFAPPGLTHGSLMEFLAPALATHGTIHVFSDEAPGTEEASPAPRVAR